MAKFTDLVSRVVISKDNPHKDTKIILRACMPRLVEQKNWRK